MVYFYFLFSIIKYWSINISIYIHVFHQNHNVALQVTTKNKKNYNVCLVIFLCDIAEGDPNNYMSYFRRATVLLALGRSKSALPDLDKVIELKPDFTAVSVYLYICIYFYIGN